MEVLIDNEFYKQVRLEYGLILNIDKAIKGEEIYRRINPRKDLKKIDTNLYELKNDLTYKDSLHYRDEEDTLFYFPKGTKVLKEHSCQFFVIDGLKPEEEYSFELKVLGGTIAGDKESILDKLSQIKKEIERVD